MERIFKLINIYPLRRIGDLIYKKEDYYIWEIPPYHKVDKDLVENAQDYFEEIIVNWNINEDIYFISSNGNIIKEVFEPSRHSSMIHYGNAFKSVEIANSINDKLKTLLEDNNTVTMYDTEVIELIELLNNKEYNIVISKLNKKIKNI